MFTTENGIASLTLKEIPYTHKAYITIQDASQPRELLAECVDFCRAVGAEEFYATGHNFLESFPLHTTIYEMKRPISDLPETDACLFPVQEKTMEQWRNIYNCRMSGVSNAAFMTIADAQRHIREGNAYFVHRNGTLLGIGIAGGERIENVISVVPGSGQAVLSALLSVLSGEIAGLIVADDNRRAVALYERLGFVKTREISRWYKIFLDVK
ncbi:MAG: hypothetical protein IKJ94_02125 [Oscillospiraceae bacterium]|nr:hypothetical protein [Oscillospiraceae bacterium]